MKHTAFTKKAAALLSVAAIVLSGTLTSCNETKKEEQTTAIDSAAFTAPVIVQDTMMKDTLLTQPIDTTKTEQVPPPRNH